MKSRGRRGGSRSRRRVVRLSGGQEVLQMTGQLRCQRSNKGRGEGFLQVGERRRSAAEKRAKVS